MYCIRLSAGQERKERVSSENLWNSPFHFQNDRSGCPVLVETLAFSKTPDIALLVAKFRALNSLLQLVFTILYEVLINSYKNETTVFAMQQSTFYFVQVLSVSCSNKVNSL